MALNEPNYRFDDFLVDVSNRQLLRGDQALDLSGRYFDALVLLLREHGQLVEKERFFSEVWRDVIVSDSALTQCIKDIRKQLGDDTADRRYVQTVPRYGYRFIGQVERIVPASSITGDGPVTIDHETPDPIGSVEIPDPPAQGIPFKVQERSRSMDAILQAMAGTLGGGVAGLLGGLLYGLALATTSGATQVGTISTVIVFLSLGSLIGVVGGFGVSSGMAIADLASHYNTVWNILGAAVGGMLIGGFAKLLGVDAFNLLLGHSPTEITGGLEGAALGAAIAIGAQLGGGLNASSYWKPIVGAGLGGVVAGVLIPLAGGQLLGGSLEILAHSFSDSRLRLDALATLFGDAHFGQTTEAILGGIEALLFGTFVIGGFILARHTHAFRSLDILR